MTLGSRSRFLAPLVFAVHATYRAVDALEERPRVDVILERLPAIDEDHGDLVRVEIAKRGIAVDVDHFDGDRQPTFTHEAFDRILRNVAEVAIAARVDLHGDHSQRNYPREERMSSVKIDLTGKVALITGASKGIGAEAAILFGEAGARVGVNYSRSEREAEAVVERIGRDRAIAIRADIGNAEEVRAMIGATVERFGRIDILVNNAAIFRLNRFEGHDYDYWREGWQRTFDVNVFGAANAAFLAVERMRGQGGGKIVNIASRAAWRGEMEFADYGASKAALVNLTKSIARSCAQYNIVANCVAPGFILTEMAEEEVAKRGSEILAEIPLGRIGTAKEVAQVILFLASPMGDYLNGATVDINGGSYVR